MNKVYNKRSDKIPEGAVYVGRPSSFGNPFEIGFDGTREQVVLKFEQWLSINPELTAKVRQELKGRDLVCWCAPALCHADVLLRVANE